MSVLFTGIVASALAITAVAWACTPGMMGNIWFCTTSSGCTSPGTSSFVKSATAWQKADGLEFSSVAYTMRYTSGTDQDTACHTSTSNFGTATTDAWGNYLAQVTMPNTAASWSACATYNDGTTTYFSQHRNFTTTN